mmetsp:Transcript_15521/g.50875  ORF Transcript_15521/g.50875 Transcript_15521/m.50875 type:complete len:628 (+) Transcript_15521:1142-3025(+)
MPHPCFLSSLRFLGTVAHLASGLATVRKMSVMRGDLDSFVARSDPSWVRQLTEDPEGKTHEPNRESREVRSGHYVLVAPTPLPSPKLLLYSEELLRDMGLDPSVVVEDERFVRFFSGDKGALNLGPTWATPYALSIMGEQMYHNCPFGNGNGYGDGRAISVGEVVVVAGGNVGQEDERRFEMQLKGGGRTPFCRGADGRAVLRSSLREFLASEAMHFLGVPTTRALCLVKSDEETVRRPWYSDDAGKDGSSAKITEDDPRLARFPPEVRAQLARQLSSKSKDPDVAIFETAAITTRVAPSFLRVGHVDLFARRALKTGDNTQLEQLLRHELFREDPDLLLKDDENDDGKDLKSKTLIVARRVAERLASLAANWLRVGFTQGNFNADNCLVGGRTMDYGPFGFVEEYDPEFAKWVGSGAHFAFAAQPAAARANFATFARSLLPLFRDDPEPLRSLVEDESQAIFQGAVDACFARKLGFLASCDASKAAWSGLEPILRKGHFDYTIFFRELAERPLDVDAETLIDRASYSTSSDTSSELLEAWLADWRRDVPSQLLSQRMTAANPKYILREWMLVEAYRAAEKGDLSVAETLYDVIKRPYDDQGQDRNAKYYRKADPADLRRPGTAFMT